MNEIAIIYGAEVLRRFRSRAYTVATAAGIVFIALIALAPTLLVKLAHAQTNTIVLAGPPALRASAQQLFGKKFHVVASLDRLPATVTPVFLDSNGQAAAAIALSFVGRRLHADIYARDPATFDEMQFSELAPLSLQLGTGLSQATSRPLLHVVRTIHGLDARFPSAAGAALARGIAFALVFMLYLAIVTAGQAVLAGVAEEKTSRIAELLVATISPISLMTGKTLAIASTTLLQMALWGLTAVVLVPQTFASSNVETQTVSFMALAAISPGMLLAFIAFFAFGFLEYATVYAAAASLVSRTEDLGSVSGPVILPAVAAFVLAQYALIAPNAPIVVAASFVPFVSPFIMFTRIAIATVPAWQIALSVAINTLAVAACFYAAGKVYRVGMLLYGKLPSLRQVVAAIRA